MAPPKCFFKRPEEFYSNGGTMLQPPKIECYSPTCDSRSENPSPPPLLKAEPIMYKDFSDFFQNPLLERDTISEPLDLSCKIIDSERNNLIKQLGSFLMQHQQQLSRVQHSLLPNHFVNLEKLCAPQTANPPKPILFVAPTFQTDSVTVESRVEISRNNRLNLSPQSISESFKDNSSSETSSQCTSSQPKDRGCKRKFDGKVLRPFKLYKGNDSKGVMEALGINEEDEEWLKSIVQYKSVDEVFQFLTNCMNDSTKPSDLSDDNIEKIQAKFGHIFQNCNMTVSNPRMIRHPDMTPVELKTDEYWEKRRKNNEAAKRSREARRHKEDSLNHHCEKLQNDNDCLRKEIEIVRLRIEEIKKSLR